MRNTTMREKLDGILTPMGLESADALVARSNDEILATVGAMRRKQSKVIRKPGFPEADFGRKGKKHGLEAGLPPRYVPPPRLANPFSVHAHSIAVVPPPPEAAKPGSPTTGPSRWGEKPVLVPAPAALEDKSKTVLPIKPEVVPSDVQQPAKDEALPTLLGDKPAAAETAPAQSADRLTLIHPLFEPQLPSPSSEPLATPSAPPNLNWPQKPSPFDADLKPIESKLRDARTRVAFTLEQLREQEKNLDTQLCGVRSQLEKYRERVRQINEAIAACVLLAEQSAGLEPGLLAAGGTHHKTPGFATGTPHITMPDKNDPTILRMEDMRQFFKEHPGKEWSAGTILPRLPVEKQAHAKSYLPSALTNLRKMDEIRCVSRGRYQAK